ncbi:hypothetical protein C453_04899 [Haloferax elongans ATCC BAA-1513]|uniref:Uncharacterized protein n=1 Tax=Haloferax elongans ATCC BAA-1513 TaxID=1230453 RepID=M0HV74_HALEO|nr:DUF6663 family protein [Haloferax elongans]ELZ87663.1 hypothetical protein C453_04899 [Haloferax elongans ATCC BAA-1513]
MEVTTAGQFRVYRSPRDRDETLLLERPDDDVDWSDPSTATEAEEAFSPTYVPSDGYEGELAETVAALEPGHVVDATLAWDDGDPRFASLDILDETRFRFVGATTGLFDAAKETWRSVQDAGEAMGSRVTYSTERDPNAVLYVFAKQSGARDLFEEFRDGVLPLDPLVGRVDEQADAPDAPREVFVMRPLDESFVLVAIAFDKAGLFARTMRETYCEG